MPPGSAPLVELRPVQEGHGTRGIGAVTASVHRWLPAGTGIVWQGLPAPPPRAGWRYVTVPGRPGTGRLGWLRSAGASARARLPRGPRLVTALEPGYLPRGGYAVVFYDAIPWRMPDLYPAGRIGQLQRAAERRLVRRAAAVLAISQASAEDAVRLLGVAADRVRVIPPALTEPWPLPSQSGRSDSTGRWRPERLVSGRRYVVSCGGVGGMDGRKRLTDLVTALTRLPEEVGVVVTGRVGPAGVQLRALAASLGVGERLVLPGQLTPEDLVDTVAGAAGFCFPSAWEGFGLPLLEAMSVGVPCVVTDAGALPEVAGGAAELVPVGQPEALAEALGGLLGSATRAGELAARGRQRAAQFSGPAMAEAYRLALEAL